MARKSRKNIQNITKSFTYNVAGYVRISSANNENIETLENQKNIILDYIKNKQDFKLINFYEDELAIIRLNLINLELSRGLIKSYFFIF